MLRPGSLLSRSLALILMLGTIFAFYEFALLPLITAHSRARISAEQTRMLLQRYNALAEQRTRLADQVSAYEKLVAHADTYLPGPDTVVAAATLQERAKSVIERAHGELRSTQVLSAQTVETGAPVRLVALKIQFRIDIDGLRDVLYEWETGNPYCFIEELVIQQHEAPDTDFGLDVSITIEGYTNVAPRADTLPSSPSAPSRGGRS